MGSRPRNAARGVRASGPAPRRTRTDRYGLLLVALVALLVGVVGRLVWVQGVEASALGKQAAEQRLRDLVITPKRGVIYDREGEPLAISVEAKTVYAVPSAVKDASAAATEIAGVLGGSAPDYERRLERKSSFSYVARKVDLEKAKRLEDLKIPGIGFLEDSKRTYPCGALAAQVLGFVGTDDTGLAGLEKQYDAVLGGKPGRVLAERDPYGRPIPGGVMKSVDAVDGRDIVLTIDKDVQYQAQLELNGAVSSFGAKSGSVVVLDPRDGSVLAMASVPTFDPNDFQSAVAAAISNRPVTQPYEPGSTIKPFIASAVIDRKLFTPTSMFHLPPTIDVGGRVIHEAHDRGSVDYSLTDIIAESSNVGAVKLGLALGKQGIFDYYTGFGFGTKTGVDFPGEARGTMPAPETWSRSSIGNIPFGQGMTATPLQLATGLSAIANGGEVVTPHLVASVPGETSATIWPKRRVISAATAKQMVGILERVVTNGTGTAARVPGFDVAGKTGTAQVAKNGSYKNGGYEATFAGFLPAGDPRVLIVVVVDEPTKTIYGGSVAAPAFSRLAQFTVDHLKIPPTNVTASPASKAPTTPVAGAHD
jgi:cell division protein FtsI/penicillin-binding protein 2